MSTAQEEQPDSNVVSGRDQQLSHLSGQTFYNEWLNAQCRKIPDCFFGLLILPEEDNSSYQITAAWPDINARLDAASELIDRVINEKSGLITALESLPSDRDIVTGTAYVLAYPVVVSNTVIAVVTVATTVTNKDKLKYAMQQLEWGCGWLQSELYRQRSEGDSSSRKRLSESVDLFSRVLAEKTFDASAIRLVSELALLFGCDRVSIGLKKNKSLKVSHLSNSAQFGKKMDLVRLIEAAMDESVDQNKVVLYPPANEDENDIVLAHEELSELQNDASIMTIPVYIHYEIFGAITLERKAEENPFNVKDSEYCQSICALAAGVLEEKLKNDRHILAKINESFKKQLSYLIGKEHYLYKLVTATSLLVVLFFTFYQTEYRLSSDAVIENSVRRSLIAPYDGYIDKAEFNAGDVVTKDQEIMSLDTKDLHLERLKWLSQKEKFNRQYQESLSKHDRAKLKIIGAQIDQAKAQLELAEMKLERAVIRAPFDGQVVSGDLSNRLGGAVKRGELLFEVAPTDNYRIKLFVSQRRIADVTEGQEGYLYLLALPDTVIPFSVTRITPVIEIKNGQSYFEVEASIHEQVEQVQPGMEGVGKISIGQRKLISILTRDVLEWFQVQWWSLFG